MTTTTLWEGSTSQIHDGPGGYAGVEATPEWAAEVKRLARERGATILAHNYQLPAIQDVADHVGDSLALSRIAAEAPEDTIVFCGVHFMAETAKILSPSKTVLIPDERAGCSLADSINAEQLREWKADNPNALVVSYVNTTAEVKGLTDICCTSSNAVDVVNSIDPDREVLFLPDQFLGAHVKRVTGRTNMQIWAGECHVHAGINGDELTAKSKAHPDADTEIGMLHQLRKAAPDVDFQAVNDRASCPYMKMITPAALLRCLLEGKDEVHVDLEMAKRAQKSVQRMIEIGNPGGGE
ncbi:MAG: quinolinate synthase subunit A [Rhodococcus sp. (in: high G+C Gram-positive bacteria)]|uniref:quinolinate synthase n=1 Tax=Rhodococcus sp. TaxID=1831 RepID=UPI00121BA569|nr:quinolinate synthase [Rhodococcus sp. (in: high G+C Gram-positive bacteria)]RZL24084.1 MAG: quinolinate synthase subunit A [Rhodococcus sp. (in: high G+C Gram-positive bacteria)]